MQMTPSLSELAKTSAEEAGNGEGDFDDDVEFEPFPLDDVQYTKQHPTTAVGGTAVALRYSPFDFEETDWGYGTPMLILDDAFVYTDEDDFADTAIFAGDESANNDYKVVNTSDEDTIVEDGIGVDFDNNLFRGEPVDGFDGDGHIALKLTGSAGRRVARTLDGNGDPLIGQGDPEVEDNGQVTHSDGLLEVPPDDVDGRTRYQRHTFCRPDVEGETLIVQLRRRKDVVDEYDGNGYWTTVTVDGEDGPEILEPIEGDVPEDVASTGWLKWSWPEEASGEDE